MLFSKRQRISRFYEIAWLLLTFVLFFISCFTFWISFAGGRIPSGFLVSIGCFAIAAGLFWGIRHKLSFAFWTSLILAVPVWGLLLYQTIRRIAFMQENGGMERADGYGSPMAFLLGIVFEQIFFIPLTLVLIAGITNWLFAHPLQHAESS